MTARNQGRRSGAPRSTGQAGAPAVARTDVVFVVMPFADIRRPAIGVSLLQAAAKARGHSSRIEYCNIDFADRIGRNAYAGIALGTRAHYLVGDWVFAEAAFGQSSPAAEKYVEEILAPNHTADIVQAITGTRTACADFVDACVTRIMAHAPRVVGFTTTFHQTCASLAVAKRLKARPDAPAIVFGGANCEGEMGVQMLESFPWIDAVSTGEADASFPRMLDALLEGRSARIGGVLFRGQQADDAVLTGIPIQDLDALPIPDYDDYFRQLEASAGGRARGAHLVVETSRGCWWGVKHHCTFCGLNGNTMAFRSKSPQRAYDEIIHLAERHRTVDVECVDNILDLRYVDTLLPMLADSPLDFTFFYEVKANLRYDQLRKMRAGGITQIQPGIESFSNQVLKLMEKGVTGLQNIQLMRWCEELDIYCTWNLLAGFPGEDPDEYHRMATLIPLLAHLAPPVSVAQLRLDRFSPNYRNHERLGFADVRPSLAYSLVFPLGPEELGRLAYYFDYGYADRRVPRDYLQPLADVFTTWRKAHVDQANRPRLDADVVADTVVVTDTRPIARTRHHELTGLTARLYLACDTATTVAALLRQPDFAGRDAEVRRAIQALSEELLLVKDGDRCLSLAVFRTRPPEVGSSDGSAQAETGRALVEA